MKKIIIVIFVILIASLSIIFTKYSEYKSQSQNIASINSEFTRYEKSIVQINTIITAMNKAIELNNDNKIEKDSNNIFIENDTNSIKVYLETKNSEGELVKIPMENLIINSKRDPSEIVYAFSDLRFNVSNIEYHKKTGKIKEITYTESDLSY